jgi:biopolymer transport protein ExbD
LAILQADETTDVRLINKIVNTAKAAGFDNLLFAVKNKS